ncbi:AAA domain-containing protein [Jiangella endophytica]|uniref:AAA domain-containing protein n=1 Tax=Jiangella endophytica TaxID=1623398 RepID=UPI000E346DC8|nr:AAA domain-containing protein [Jiangella endophytica]
MIDPRREAVLVRPKDSPEFSDDTWKILSYREESARVWVTYRGGREYPYSRDRAVVLRNPKRHPLADHERVEVDGEVWANVTDVLRFDGPGGPWWRIFYRKTSGEANRTYRRVRIIGDARRSDPAAGVFDYWRGIVSRLSDDDPLQRPYGDLRFVHPESVLGRYLHGELPGCTGDVMPRIFPFSSNASQREAVRKALNHPISVIDGPPGTGKTQTILNLIATILLDPGKTVGVVSYSNSAVDNVRDKLVALGFGHIVASLGNASKKEAFFELQPKRNAEVTAFVSQESPTPSVTELDDVGRQLYRLQEDEQRLAQWREELAAYRLERRHFARYFDRQELPELERLPLLRRSAETILDYLADTELSRYDGPVGKLVRRIKGYFKYGPTGQLDPSDTDVVLQLQRAYYDRKIVELERLVEQTTRALERADISGLSERHRLLSVRALRAALHQRYGASTRVDYKADDYRLAFGAFAHDYPVILSTCHSLRTSIPSGHLLDYLIIDEASQVDLLAGGLALASSRNVVIVGDVRQLPHIPAEEAGGAEAPPSAAYDYVRHNLLSSVIELYGDSLPRTLLREHYRSDPAIIGFCNRKFYSDQLIPYTEGSPDAQPLVLYRTPKGNHMRQHRGGGRSNQREVDVIRDEVISKYCAGTQDADIGVTTPYRHQVDKIADALIKSIQADTVHKFQGREKDVVIMTTVLDETWRGRTGTRFVDEPRLVNVAVSRAKKRFVLVTNYDLLPKSRNLRDLIDYIRYRNLDHELVESEVVSVFDLLYRDYSARLQPLARRLRREMAYKSEDIVWTVVREILDEPPYAGLDAVPQVLLRNLLLDLTRLTPEQAAYVKHRASVDFVVYNRVTNRPLLAIEVDGFQYHENNPRQLARDALKDQICASYDIPLLRLPTTGSGEEELIRRRLDVLLNGTPPPPPEVVGTGG